MSPDHESPRRDSLQGGEASSPFRGAQTYPLPGPGTTILQVGKLRPSEGTSRKPPGSARLPGPCAPTCTRLHTPRCVRPGNPRGRVEGPGLARGSAAGRRARALTRIQRRARACVDPAAPRGTEAETTPDPPASHYVPHKAWVPLITARRPAPGRASFHRGPQSRRLISAWGHRVPLPTVRGRLHRCQVEPEASCSRRPPVPAGRDAARRSRSDFHLGPALCLGAPHWRARPA